MAGQLVRAAPLAGRRPPDKILRRLSFSNCLLACNCRIRRLRPHAPPARSVPSSSARCRRESRPGRRGILGLKGDVPATSSSSWRRPFLKMFLHYPFPSSICAAQS
ncbi:hypothetical protein GUJ93_ZPchr0019g2684 [Zizania palustris]|uniref:Uncharacterized protein n=1 Tax=Zizania palustris TaxID=103762 RepID=A0A8J5T7G0_ZIZPA|nr:hypothetical protein GUJ93_ZPchr0019g2684 [Zizania palustris]